MSETRINKRRTYAKNDRNYSLSPPESPNSPLNDLTPDDKESKSDCDENGKTNGIHLWVPFKQLDNIAWSKKDEKDDQNYKEEERWLLLFITVISLATRWYKAGWGDRTIWDEYGLNYVKHEFFHDVHPPLGKLLVGLSGKLAGYTGDFTFESGAAFPKDLNYGFMRLFVSAFGAAIVPFGYLTTKFVGLSLRCRLLTTVLLLFDNGFIVISKFILLDPFLLCFTAGTICSWSSFYFLRSRPFGKAWQLSLFSTGLFMGLNCSVKWGVPLFLVALIGLVSSLKISKQQYTIHQLWIFLKDPKISWTDYIRHWIFRIFALLLLPVTIYLLSFKVHFGLLTKLGTESYTMDSVFISRLEGSGLETNRIEVVDGANVTLRATILNGGLLHSHDHKYPSGSKEQQVTSFRELDYNNNWIVDILHPRSNESGIKDGTVLNLKHSSSELLLTVHPGINSPVQGKNAYEVSASSPSQFSQWKVRIYDDRQARNIRTVNAITTRIQLESVHGECLLASADRHLPAWGFKQLEVNCIKDIRSTGFDTLWNFEYNYHAQLPPAPKGHIKPRFAWDVFRVHHAMWSTNVGLIPDPDKFNPLESVALDWPLLRRGIRMCSWEDDDMKFFMFGNPILWWFTSITVILFILQGGWYTIRVRRQILRWSSIEVSRFLFMSYAVFGGWCLHYIPFFFMTRVLYLHHYFPSLYFACLLAPYSLELTLTNFSQKAINHTFMIVALSCFISFLLFSPLTYGFDYSPTNLYHLKWFDSWLFVI